MIFLQENNDSKLTETFLILYTALASDSVTEYFRLSSRSVRETVDVCVLSRPAASCEYTHAKIYRCACNNLTPPRRIEGSEKVRNQKDLDDV